MTKKDRDRLFELIIFYDELTNWQTDTESEINEKDKKKLKVITDMILALLVQYRKREGEEALKSLLVESQKFDFGIPIWKGWDAQKFYRPDGTIKPVHCGWIASFQDTWNENIILKD